MSSEANNVSRKLKDVWTNLYGDKNFGNSHSFAGGNVGMLFLADSIEQASKRISKSIDGYTEKMDEHYQDEKKRYEEIPDNPFEKIFSNISGLPGIEDVTNESTPDADSIEGDTAVVISLNIWQNVKTLLKECESVLGGPGKTEAEVALGGDVEGLLNMIEEFERGPADSE